MLREYFSSEIKSIPDEQANVLKGDSPFDVIVESITEQFDEFLSTGYINKDKTNYIDKMREAINMSEQINRSDIDEFDIDQNETITQMKEMFHSVVIELMNAIGVDLYQIDDPDKIAYHLYTNFMLTNQREGFFNYVVRQHVMTSGLETELAIAHGRMLDGEPDDMYRQIDMMFDGKDEQSYVVSFLNDCGFSDIIQWVSDGFMPVSILFDTFLSMKQSLAYMFIGYYQSEKARYE